MTNDTRSPEDIERDIERERAGLTNTLDDLQDRFSVESIARQVTDSFREHGGDLGRSVSDAVKRNPVALALTGVGLAWLMMDKRSDSYRHDGYRNYRGYRNSADRVQPRGYGYVADDRYDRDPDHRPRSLAGQPLYSGRYGSAEGTPDWARDDRDDHRSAAYGLRQTARDAGHRMSDTASDVSGSVRETRSSVADKAKSVATKARDAGTPVKEGAQGLASSASERASALRDRLAQGTEDLTEDARHRVVEARRRALEARDAAADYARQARGQAVDIFEQQPLVAGALAVALGAALGAALPRSRVEDEYLGEQSDHLMAEAERIFEEEREKLGKVAKAVTDETRQAAREMKAEADEAVSGSSVEQAAEDKAKSTGKRIADAAKTEAEKQDLGKVGKSPKSGT
ncbi:DUF3618 domain-containing protein [Maritimibacter sp. DP1N21-5]|uniref:DUF3618 domain-containing protein n=1 Tax=Maritimibacter sp. DP1N21-5 TaxID=2836867 RepID=UPI001C48AC10|nr:DUF3618 domain-containing protein [Maritimibacter sp. DP1N21-5]MBV7411087.1 DUF3618 domain-containing protein [Maritimibacter sp. DP1N21-5]